MSLPAPNLDNRKFQDIVDEVKQQIGLRCPEWTDHNVSDPGVTLIELFAMMTEMMIYRMNQVPDRNYVKFLEMIGVSLEPPKPARTDLRFYLSRNIEDRAGEEVYETTLLARETVAASVRTESEEAIEFATDADLHLARPRLEHVFALPAGAALDLPNTPADAVTAAQMPGLREFQPDRVPFPIFGPRPQNGDALYLGFRANVSRNLIELEVDSVNAAAPELDEDYPAQKWEVWNSADKVWKPLSIVRDTTMGFNRALGDLLKTAAGNQPTGFVELEMPADMQTREIAGQRAYWVRCVYATDLPPRGTEQRLPAAYTKSPTIRSIEARTIGGVVTASQCSTVLQKILGQSDGLPGQVFRIGQAPIMALRPDETILVGPQDARMEELQAWQLVEDFAESEKDDRHFVCDTYAGEIRFGPNILQPDGSTRQHGAIPEKSMTITLSSYRYGGGTRGNVAAEQITVLKSTYKYIASVVNPTWADGGSEQESLEHAKMRGRAVLRMRDRAVTAEDYEYLASKVQGVGRARCLQPGRLHAAGENGEHIPPGVVRVLLIPSVDRAIAVPRPAQWRVSGRIRNEVEAYLDQRRLLTAVLEVGEPDYVYVSTDITLVANPQMDPEQVKRNVRDRLNVYIHPLTGGPGGTGWVFRHPLRLSDIYAQIQAATGVAFLLDVKMFVSRVTNLEEGLLGPEERIPDIERVGLRLLESEMLCTRDHRILVRPMWAAENEASDRMEGDR